MRQALHNHHIHEDVVLWDSLKNRAPESAEDVARMEEDHPKISQLLTELEPLLHHWQAHPEEQAELIAKYHELRDALFQHLSDEENIVRLVASKVMTQAEWDRMA